jgi:hypothetical protein
MDFPLEVIIIIAGYLPFVEQVRFLCQTSSLLRRKVFTRGVPLPFPMPPLAASILSLRPLYAGVSEWEFLLDHVLCIQVLKGKRFLAPEAEPDRTWAGFTHLVMAVIASDGCSVTVTELFGRRVMTLPICVPFKQIIATTSIRLVPPIPTTFQWPHVSFNAGLLISKCSRYGLELHPNGRLWMKGETTGPSSALPSKWSSCLVLDGALHLEDPPYVSQKVVFL